MSSIRWEDRTLQILVYIVILTGIIFYIDIHTPLGFMIGILYFIPLFLTVYIRWKYTPFIATAVFITLITVGLFLPPRDMSVLFALMNRLFFSLVLIIMSVFIWIYTRNLENLRIDEERYRYLSEWSPDAILVYQKGKIIYANPAGLRLFAMDAKERLLGKDLTDIVDPDDRDRVCERIRQAIRGARIVSLEADMKNVDGKKIHTELSMGKVIWDEEPALQIVMRDIARRGGLTG